MNARISAEINEFYKGLPSMSDEQIGTWLLRAGDNERVNKVMYYVLVTSLENEPSGRLIQAITYAMVFVVKTRCEHNLPRPYAKCKCNFTIKHWKRLLDFLKSVKCFPYDDWYEIHT